MFKWNFVNNLLLIQVLFFKSFKGGRRPLAREPEQVYRNDDIADTNVSIECSAMLEYLPMWLMLDPNLSSVLVSMDDSLTEPPAQE